MGLVSKVGRKRTASRLAMGTVYLLFCLGAATTLYPFLLMISGSLKGPTDQNDNRLVPAFLSQTDYDIRKPSDLSLLGKYLADKYGGDMAAIESARIGSSASSEQVALYERWLSELPPDRWTVGFRTAPNQITGKLEMRYQDWLRTKYPSVQDVNQAYGEQNGAFQQVVPPPERWEDRTWKPVEDRKWREWLDFKQGLPTEFRIPIRAQKIFQDFGRLKQRAN